MEDEEQALTEDIEHQLIRVVRPIVARYLRVKRVAANATKALCRLSSVGTDTLEAALKARTSQFHLKKAGSEHLIAQLAALPTGKGTPGAKVAQRLLDEQHRIDQVVCDAMRHLVLDPSDHSEDGAQEMDDDWIESFRREAADRSQGEMRETFARILAGEICEPGAFSIKTVRIVGSLSQSTAAQFRRAASLRVGLEAKILNSDSGSRLQVLDARIPSLGGSLSQNFLRAEGLDYYRLIVLTENGLLHHEYASWHIYNGAMPHPQIRDHVPALMIHQGRKWALSSLPGFKNGTDLKIYGAKFTNVGAELLKIVDIEQDEAFQAKVKDHLITLHVDMVPLSD